MRTSRVCVLLGAAAIAILSATMVPAQAADLGYSIKDIPPPPPSGRAWYLKGTIGMKNAEPGGIDIDEPAYDDSFTTHHKDIKSTALYGFGIGVEHSRWLRFDLTGEYRGKQLFVAQDSYNNGLGCSAAAPGVNCGTNEYTADLESWLGLFNAYIDIGTWRGVTPYVGGGIGIASIDVQGFKDVNVPAGSVFYGNRDNSTTNFAWALYAGLSYDVTDQLTLDFAYRYTDLGDAATGRATAFDGSSSYSGLKIEDITSHDLLLSARYRLDHPAPAYPVAIK
jgi:opacity protein-like surface antigen